MVNPIGAIYGGIILAFLGAGMSALGVWLAFRLDEWKRWAATVVALAGGLVVFWGLRSVLYAFGYCW